MKAFENQVLAIPSEAMAMLAPTVRQPEGASEQALMPLTDLCSGAMQVQPRQSRLVWTIHVILSNDNCYFRAKAIEGSKID